MLIRYTSAAEKPAPLRQGVGKYIAQTTWEQAHAPAPRWGGAAAGAASSSTAAARGPEADELGSGELPPPKKAKKEARGFGDFTGW